MIEKKVGVMQPYLFPYLGYFQLINAVDYFVFYDDVNFIKGGWINRNNILINGNSKLISVPLQAASSNKEIKEIEVNSEHNNYKKILISIQQAYSKAPQYAKVISLIEGVFNKQYSSIAEMAQSSIEACINYLGISTKIYTSSIDFSESKGEYRADRLISIVKKLNATTYINAAGGKVLYEKTYFKNKGVNLLFIDNELIPYQQFDNNFIKGLSIIDVLMFNSKEEVEILLDKYKLE